MFDFPEPFGPVTAVYPSISGTVSLPPNDLKFSNSTCFKYTLNPSQGGLEPKLSASHITARVYARCIYEGEKLFNTVYGGSNRPNCVKSETAQSNMEEMSEIESTTYVGLIAEVFKSLTEVSPVSTKKDVVPAFSAMAISV